MTHSVDEETQDLENHYVVSLLVSAKKPDGKASLGELLEYYRPLLQRRSFKRGIAD